MTRNEIQEIMNGILARQNKAPTGDEKALLRDVGFRSLDFSELALRVERSVGRELNFDAGQMRAIRTVGDVLAFFVQAAGHE